MTRRVFGPAFCLLLLSITAAASPFSDIVVFGDSLSDQGRTFAAIGYPPPPYYDGRFSNGPVAAEILAFTLGADLESYAWGGATTGLGNSLDGGNVAQRVLLPGMRPVFDEAAPSLTPSPQTLYMVWGGPNDFLAPAPDAIDDPPSIAARAIGNLMYIVQGLQLAGADHILVLGIPDLGLTPYFQSLGQIPSAGASMLTDQFNAALAAQVGLVPGARFYDTPRLQRLVHSNPSAYGFSNVSQPCVTAVSLCSDPGSYFYWDDFHPTTAAHAILAADIANIPEPATCVLVSCGLALLMISRRRKSQPRS